MEEKSARIARKLSRSSEDDMKPAFLLSRLSIWDYANLIVKTEPDGPEISFEYLTALIQDLSEV